VIGAKILSGRELEIAKRIESNETEHVKALEAAARNLEGEPAAREETDFSSVLDGGRGKVLRTAATIEGVGAGAYLGQVRFIESKEILASLLSIHAVEGRHAAVLNRLVGRPFSPSGGFAEPLSKAQVTKAITPYVA
jgi:ferritin-like protein